MKKILLITISVLGLTVASAQENTKKDLKQVYLETETTSKKLANALLLDDADVFDNIKAVISHKNQLISENENLSADRKKALVEYVESSLKELLTEIQFEKFTSNKELYDEVMSVK